MLNNAPVLTALLTALIYMLVVLGLAGAVMLLLALLKWAVILTCENILKARDWYQIRKLVAKLPKRWKDRR